VSHLNFDFQIWTVRLASHRTFFDGIFILLSLSVEQWASTFSPRIPLTCRKWIRLIKASQVVSFSRESSQSVVCNIVLPEGSQPPSKASHPSGKMNMSFLSKYHLHLTSMISNITESMIFPDKSQPSSKHIIHAEALACGHTHREGATIAMTLSLTLSAYSNAKTDKSEIVNILVED
jgi:hypothetical protein